MTDFESWLERHSEKFMTYNYQEIAELAVACGFPREEVFNWLQQRRKGAF